ncbi:MAG TPA: DUF397 domain-containing protein [Streptosporangiaceae bacterium]
MGKSVRPRDKKTCMSRVITEPGELCWHKASHSANNGACVEVARAHGTIAVRDSKDPDGPILWYSAGTWKTFLIQQKYAAISCAD